MVADKRARSHLTSIEKTHRSGGKGKFVNMSQCWLEKWVVR
jgi:hypothetical protein